jgi:hypothetical protein
VNAGFISAGCFTQNKPSFNQADQACYNSGDGDRYFCGVLSVDLACTNSQKWNNTPQK